MTTSHSGLAFVFLTFVGAALGQTSSAPTFPFQLLFTEGQNGETVTNGASVTFLAPVGQSQTAQFQATYTGSGQATFSAQPGVFGSSEFSATMTSALPATLSPGANVIVTIQFKASSAAAASAEINLPYMETLANGASDTGTITLSLQGTAPSFVLSYAFQANQNVVPLQPGGVIPFPSTLVGSTAQAALNLTDTGSGAGAVTSVTVAGAAFTLQGVPLLPANVAPNATLTVQVLYAPSGATSDTGQITIMFSTGSPVTIVLSGNGTLALFAFQLLNTSPPTAVSPGGTIALPDTPVGQTTSLSFRVLNSGNANGTVSSISVAGQGFTLSSPPVLPQTLAAGASLTFTITFSPTQPGALSGTLIVNSATFTLSGNGLGALLTYSYVAGGTTITLSSSNNSVVFSPVAITQSEQLSLDVKNSGTLSATISNIGVGQTSGPFTISGLPPLPVTLAANSDFHITITFTPSSLGFSNGTLLFDATSIALVGSGTAPPPLPSYSLSGPSGNSPPMTQPSISLTLASPYPVDISGTLTMTVAGSLPSDPAVQFASGGRTVSFVIPANQTDAAFGSVGTQIGIQTGTVAGTITLTPSFATQAGNVDLTPNAPPSLQLTVASAAPALMALQLTNLSNTGFTIQVTGFATTRSLNSFAVQFTTASGFSMPSSQFSVDVSQISTLWFQSTASQTYGGQFTLSIPFSFQGSLPSGKSIVNVITSASVTMSNGTGTSNSVQATLQ